jgi:hypothetical protein
MLAHTTTRRHVVSHHTGALAPPRGLASGLQRVRGQSNGLKPHTARQLQRAVTVRAAAEEAKGVW